MSTCSLSSAGSLSEPLLGISDFSLQFSQTILLSCNLVCSCQNLEHELGCSLIRKGWLDRFQPLVDLVEDVRRNVSDGEHRPHLGVPVHSRTDTGIHERIGDRRKESVLQSESHILLVCCQLNPPSESRVLQREGDHEVFILKEPVSVVAVWVCL